MITGLRFHRPLITDGSRMSYALHVTECNKSGCRRKPSQLSSLSMPLFPNFAVHVLLLLPLLIAAMSHALNPAPCPPQARSSYPAPSSTICNVSSQSSGLMIYAYALQDGRAPGIGWQLFEYSDAGDSGVKIVDLTPIPGPCPPQSHPRALSTDSSSLCGRICRQRHPRSG